MWLFHVVSLGETALLGMQGVMGTKERCVSWPWCFVVVFLDLWMKGNWACRVKSFLWLLKVLYVGLTPSGWTRYCSPNSKYWRRFFSPGPSSSDLRHRQVARLTTPTPTWHMTMKMNEIKYAVFSANWQPRVPKYNWVNWQWAGFTNHNKHRHSGRNTHFQRRITDCSIVFQINKYVNLACFLNICKHIMVFLCFSRVKILHTAPLMF